MRRFMMLICLAGSIAASAAYGQECDRNDGSRAAMNICADQDYKAADAKLNKSYEAIMKRLSEDADGKKRLHAAQRAWLAFRDAECSFQTSGQEGSVAPMLTSLCFQGLTEDRTKQLNGYLHCKEGDMSCPVPAQ